MTKSVGEKQKQRPGTRLMATGIVVLVLGFALLMVNLTSPVTNYVAGAGLVATRSPSIGAIMLIAAGLLLAAIGFGRRVLSAVEK
jgi:predicted metal-binding membrane protein